MNALKFKISGKSLRAWRADATLREFQHMIVDSQELETDEVTHQMNGLSFILGAATCATVFYMVFAIGQTIGVWL